MKYKKGLIIFTLFYFGLIHTSCNFNDDKKNVSLESKKYDVGLSLATLNEDRWLRDRDVFVSELESYGVTVDVQVANNSSIKQYEQVKEMIQNGIKVLVVAANDADEATKIVDLAREKDVKVICYDRIIRNAGADLYISFNHIEVGSLMAEYLIDNVPKGNYVIINGPESDNNSIFIKEGYDKVLNKAVEKESIDIISETFTDNWSPEEANELVRSLLKNNKKIDAIICANDKLAGGAISALSEKSLAGKIKVVGGDADLAACQRIVNGTQNITIYKPIDKLAKSAAEIVYSILNNENLEINNKINDGKYDIPFYKVGISAIDSKNLYDIIIKEEAFHRVEEVYMDIDESEWPDK
jgi:D-xylose transport system substrate-binding protein